MNTFVLKCIGWLSDQFAEGIDIVWESGEAQESVPRQPYGSGLNPGSGSKLSGRVPKCDGRRSLLEV